MYKVINFFNKKNFFIFLSLVFIQALLNTVFASNSDIEKVPIYNHHKTTFQLGLYRISDMKEARYGHKMLLLSDGQIMIFGGAPYSDSKQQIEIFNPETFKFKKIKNKSFYNHSIYSSAIQLDDGRVLLADNSEGTRLEIFVPETNKFINTEIEIARDVVGKYGKCNYPLTKLENGDVIIFCSAYSKTGKNNMVHYNFIYNTKENTLSAPILSNSSNFVSEEDILDKFKKNKKTPFLEIGDVSNYEKAIKLYFEQAEFLKPNKIILCSRLEADYGVTNKVINGFKESWFSPIYEYDVESKKIFSKKAYIRSWGNQKIKLKDRNIILITGGKIPSVFKLSEPTFGNPSKIPYSLRHFDNANIYTKHAYIYVY